MRFALLEIKLTLVKLLKQYDIIQSPKTIKENLFKETIVVRRPVDGLYIIFKKRK